MATLTDFRPYTVEHSDYVGTILRVNAVGATIPDDLLPRRVRLAAGWRRVGGMQILSWYAEHDGGMTKLPAVPGDGTQDLRQLVDWLEARGYRRTTAGDDPDAVYERESR